MIGNVCSATFSAMKKRTDLVENVLWQDQPSAGARILTFFLIL